jgi:transcriptional regulator with XRE-family HTH domain
MKPKTVVANSFPQALKKTRTALRLPQEAFSLVSSRTYVSSLERGLQSPTLNKVDSLAAQINVHPLTVLALSYLEPQNKRSADLLLESIQAELHMLLDRAELHDE